MFDLDMVLKILGVIVFLIFVAAFIFGLSAMAEEQMNDAPDWRMVESEEEEEQDDTLLDEEVDDDDIIETAVAVS